MLILFLINHESFQSGVIKKILKIFRNFLERITGDSPVGSGVFCGATEKNIPLDSSVFINSVQSFLIRVLKICEVTWGNIPSKQQIPLRSERDLYVKVFTEYCKIKTEYLRLKVQRFLIRIFQSVQVFSSGRGKARVSAAAALDFFGQFFNQCSGLIDSCQII